MIVAAYAKNNLAFTLPVNPVGQIDRLAPQSRRQQRSKQNQNSSFAALLNAMLQVEDPDDAHEFDAFA